MDANDQKWILEGEGGDPDEADVTKTENAAVAAEDLQGHDTCEQHQ